MISVSISINGTPIYTRTAVRYDLVVAKGTTRKLKVASYKLDTGEELLHNPDDGAVPLAIAMLRTIKEQK